MEEVEVEASLLEVEVEEVVEESSMVVVVVVVAGGVGQPATAVNELGAVGQSVEAVSK